MRTKKTIRKRIRNIRDAERKILHRLWQGLKKMPAKELTIFMLQNFGEGVGRGIAKEMKSK